MGRKNSALEVEMRIEDIMNQMTRGVVATRDLLQFITDKYSIGVDQAAKDIAKAKKNLRGLFSDWEKEEQKNLAIRRYNLLFNKNFTIQDYREARNVQQQLDKILGNEEPTKSESKVIHDIPVINWVKNNGQ